MPAILSMNFRLILIIFLILSLYHNHDVIAEQALNIYADEISIDEANEKIIATGEAIVINESKTIKIPDFTSGKWKESRKSELLRVI